MWCVCNWISLYLFISSCLSEARWMLLITCFRHKSRGTAYRNVERWARFPSIWARFTTWINCQRQQADILRQRWHHCACTSWVIFQHHKTWLQGQKVSLTTFKLQLKPVMCCSLLLFRVSASLEQPGEYSSSKCSRYSFLPVGGKGSFIA